MNFCTIACFLQQCLAHGSGFRNSTVAVLLALFLAGQVSLWSTSASGQNLTASVGLAKQDELTQEYKSAKQYVAQLEQGSSVGNTRGNWLKGVQNFHRIYLADKKSSLSPSCLFMMGKTYRKMYDLFHVPIDLVNSTDSFQQVTDAYPAHTLADDALFNVAENLRLDPANKQISNNYYRKIIEVYPKGDHYAQANARLEEIGSVKATSVETAISQTEPGTGLAQMQPVKYWSSSDYTRIVIQTSSPVQFTSNLLEKNNETPRRLFIDFSQSFIPTQSRNILPIQDGLLKQVRTGQFSSDTVRVVLDIESLSEYKIFSLNDPFRVVVDIHGNGAKNDSAAQKAVAVVPQPAPQVEKKAEVPSLVKESDKSSALIVLADQKKKRPALAPPKGRPTQKNEISLAQQLGLGVRKIVIDPGHGGKDPGAMAFGLKEKDIVLAVAQRVAQVLKDKYKYEVSLTRTKDVFIPLEERTAIANTRNSDLFVSIHVNAHPDKTIGGVETYYLNLATNADAMRVAALENATSTHSINELQDILTDLMKNSKIDESSRLAQFVQTNLVSGLDKKYKTRDLGVKQAPFYVLIGAEMPAVLAEISFITNPAEAKLLQETSYIKQIAEQIAAGIAAYVDHHHTAALKY